MVLHHKSEIGKKMETKKWKQKKLATRRCQALCCMAPGCKYASVRKDTKTEDYVFYKEEVKYFYCR